MGILNRFSKRIILEVNVRRGMKNIRDDVPQSVVEKAMGFAARRGKMEHLERLCLAYPNVRPDEELVRDIYDDDYFQRNMDRSRAIYNLTGIKPRLNTCLRKHNVRNIELEAKVLDKSIETLLLVKKRYVANLSLVDTGIVFRRGFKQDFYDCLDVGGMVMLDFPVYVDADMFNTPVSKPYIELNNLWLEDEQRHYIE